MAAGAGRRAAPSWVLWAPAVLLLVSCGASSAPQALWTVASDVYLVREGEVVSEDVYAAAYLVKIEGVIIVVEVGLITPPIGMNVFMVKTVLGDVDVWTVFNGVWPFLCATLVGLALICAFPQIALFLPDLMPSLR